MCIYTKKVYDGSMQNRIKILRKKRGLTMQQLADLVQTTQQQIDRLEKSRRRLTVDWLEKLSLALDCEMVELLPLGSSTRNVQTTSRAKVIGTVATAEENALTSYADKDTYTLLFGRPRQVVNPKLFGLLVTGNGIKEFPEGSELIFSEIVPEDEIAPGKWVVCQSRKGGYYVRKTPLGGEDVIRAVLVKSIREE
ncbi:MAG: XRE family transcriptional regulator [Proteobacteria bacterium]|nr:XRE family transcriptional regulator [Pseudomonadota bacterium]